MRKILALGGFLVSFTFAAFGQTQLIQDGGFESPVFTAWNISGTGASIKNNSAIAHGGANYLSMGNVAGILQSVSQTITVPSNSVAAILTYDYNIFSPGGSSVDVFHAVVNRNDGSFAALIDSRTGADTDPTQGNPYHQIAFDLTAFAGQTIQIAFQALDSASGSGTIFNVDDVSVFVELPSDIPPNDFFTNRTVIAGNSAVKFGTNIFATKETGEPNHANNLGGKSLWWSWTAPTNGVLQLNTVGSTFFTLLAAYSGDSVTNLTKLAANNGANNNDGFGRVSFGVIAQTEIQIAVDGVNNTGDTNNAASGAIVLNLIFKPDTNRPTVLISSPAAGAKVATNAVTVLGDRKSV